MKRNILVAILLLAIFTYSCTIKEEPLQDSLSPMSDLALVDDGSIVDEPIVLVEGFIPDKEDFPDTKTALTITEGSGGGAKFTFVDGDRLGIFPYSPTAGVQMPFELKSSEAKTAVFNCPGFSLVSGTAYAAYYPYNSTASSHSSIPVNYTGQWQPSAAAPASSTSANFNISSADYLIAKATPSGNACQFKMSHVGALVVMDITVSQSLKYTELSLNSSSSSFIQTGTLNLAQDYTLGTNSNPTQGIAISSPSTAQKMTLKLGSSTGSGIDLTAGQTYRFCMMVPPTNVTGTVTIRLKDNSNVEHIGYVPAKNLRQGYAYRYEYSFVPVNLSASETANSYIVSEAGQYYFDASVAGNGNAGKMTGVSGSGWYPAAGTYLLTKTPSATVPIKQHFITNSCITNLAYNSSTKKISFTATGNEGVAKISLDEGGDCIWTWLIWCTDPPKTITYSAPSSPCNTFTIMDRNLGATMASGSELTSNDDIPKICGLYYQWGRPVPLSPDYEPRNFTAARVASDKWSTSMEQSFKDADRYFCSSDYDMYCYIGDFGDPWRHSGLFWGNNVNDMTTWRTVDNIPKTIYDPCPPGYQVAPPDFMRNFEDTADFQQLSGDLHGIWLNGTGGSAFFPYAGRCNQNGMADRWKRGRFIGIGGGDAYNDGSWAVMWTSGSTAANSQACWFWEITYRNDGRGSYGGTRSNTDINDGKMKAVYAASIRCVVDH